jgi:hypothetical protein
MGTNAGFYNSTGVRNSFIGSNSGLNNTTGSYNSALGFSSGNANTTGSYNTYFGYAAGNRNTGGSYNLFIGNYAGFSNLTGNSNTSLGYMAGYSATGSGNVFLGNQAGQYETGSNKLYIDNSGTSLPLIAGDFTANTVRINGTLTQSSSREYKDNIKDLKAEDAMNTLEGLTPVTFTYKEGNQEQHVGFIAEDVPDLVATKDRKGLSSMDIVSVLTKVVQEQQKTINDLQVKNSRLEQLEQRLLALEGK